VGLRGIEGGRGVTLKAELKGRSKTDKALSKLKARWPLSVKLGQRDLRALSFETFENAA